MECVPPSVLHKVESGLRLDVDEFLLSAKRTLEKQLQELMQSVQNRLVEEVVDNRDAIVQEVLSERRRAARSNSCNISDSAFALSISGGSCPLRLALPKLAPRCPTQPAAEHDCTPESGVPCPKGSQPPQIASSRWGLRGLASQRTPAVSSTRPLQRPPPPRTDEARLPALPDELTPSETVLAMGGVGLKELSNISRTAAAASSKGTTTLQREDSVEILAAGNQEKALGPGEDGEILEVWPRREQEEKEEEDEEEEDGVDGEPLAIAQRTVRQLSTMAISKNVDFNRYTSPAGSGASNESMREPSCLKKVVEHNAFEMFFSAVILLNCASMGVEAHATVTDEVPPTLLTLVDVLEITCTSLFVVEIVLQWWVYGLRKFVPTTSAGALSFLDAMLAFAGVLSTFIVPIISLILGSDSDKNSLVRTLVSLRAVRLVRVVRVVRQVSYFHEVWMLIQGLTSSIRTLFWTIVTIFFLTYIFAIFGCWIIADPIMRRYTDEQDPSQKKLFEEMLKYVGGLDNFMMTLIQLLTLDSWNGFARLITQAEPYSIYFWYMYIAVGCLVLTNLVTAIIVDNAMATSRKDQEVMLKEKEAKRHQELTEIQVLFGLMDADQDGSLSWDEFKQAFHDRNLRHRWGMLDLHPQDCKEIFNLLDDGDGTIDREEFFEGLTKLKGSASSRDVYRVQKTVDRALKLLESCCRSEKLSPRPP